MNSKEIQSKLDDITNGVGVRLTNGNGTAIYARVFVVDSEAQGKVVVAFPLDPTFDNHWSTPFADATPVNSGLVLTRDNGLEIQIYPLGSMVRSEIVELGKSSRFTIKDAESVVKTQWS